MLMIFVPNWSCQALFMSRSNYFSDSQLRECFPNYGMIFASHYQFSPFLEFCCFRAGSRKRRALLLVWRDIKRCFILASSFCPVQSVVFRCLFYRMRRFYSGFQFSLSQKLVRRRVQKVFYKEGTFCNQVSP